MLITLLKGLSAKDEATQRALQTLLAWDYRMEPDSIAATIYTTWMKILSKNACNLCVPKEAQVIFPPRPSAKVIDLILSPNESFGPDPLATRNTLLIQSLAQAVQSLRERLGRDMSHWQYGQEKYHHVNIQHMLSSAVNDQLRRLLDVGPLPRGGDGDTVNNTSDNDNQTSGATFRIIVDLGDWDNSLGTNAPGQSGDPRNRHYADLFPMWAKGKYFPVFFSRDKILSVAEKATILEPGQPSSKI